MNVMPWFHRGVFRLCAPALALVPLALFGASGCDDDPPVDNTPPPLSPEDVDRACARIASCQPPASESPGECATAALTRPASGIRLTQDWVDCLDAAGGDCEAVARCAPQISGDPCADMPQGRACQGDLLISCFGGSLEYATDCAAWGLECAVIDEEATCRGTGRSCLEGDERCDGDRAVMCLGFREATFECGRLVRGRVCQERSGRAVCVPAEELCEPQMLAGTCEGSLVGFCSASGEGAVLDCTSLGFAGCVQQADRAVCGEP